MTQKLYKNDPWLQMSEQQKILTSSCDGGKVGELIGYIEHQRDIYRKNVEDLLNKLDPDRHKVDEPVDDPEEKENLPQSGFTGFTHKPKIILKSRVMMGLMLKLISSRSRLISWIGTASNKLESFHTCVASIFPNAF